MIGKFLLWLQEHIKPWTKPAAPALVSCLLSARTRSRCDLIVENARLRHQLIGLKRQVKRPQLINSDRFGRVLLAHVTKYWKQALQLVQPDTMLRWHRELFRLYWRRKSHAQPKISSEMINLIRRMGSRADTR